MAMMSEIHVGLLGLGFLLIGLAFVGNEGYDQEADILSNYCEMVQIGIDSGGSDGWPDFEGTFQEHCE